MPACYAGPSPIRDQDRPLYWRWAKEHGGIDQGVPYEQVRDNINQHFFAGQAKDEWIDDLLGGRKTPFRQVANDAWKAQYNRRMVTQQAQRLIADRSMGPIAKRFQQLAGVPRYIATFGHGWTFPVIHTGDLAFRPLSWGNYFRLLKNVYSVAPSKVATERVLDSMRRNPNYDLAIHSKLDVGPGSHAGNLLNRPEKGSYSTRSWDMITKARFDMWNQQMAKWQARNPKASAAQQLEVGAHFADWANHATGSAKTSVMLGKMNLSSMLLFGPKLTASKLSRIIMDPLKTGRTLANWKNATAGEQAVAKLRLSGATQYFATLGTFLAANYGLNRAFFGTKDKDNVNFGHPEQSDWLAFKLGGMKINVPGMYTELKDLGQMLFAPALDPKTIAQVTGGTSRDPGAYFWSRIEQYGRGKLTPGIGLATEVFTGRDFMGRPMPWSSNPGTASKPRYRWDEWFASHAPIIAAEPAKYFYEQMRKAGASDSQAGAILKGAVISAVGASGLKISEATPPESKQQKAMAERKWKAGLSAQDRLYLQEQVQRERAAQQLRERD